MGSIHRHVVGPMRPATFDGCWHLGSFAVAERKKANALMRDVHKRIVKKAMAAPKEAPSYDEAMQRSFIERGIRNVQWNMKKLLRKGQKRGG